MKAETLKFLADLRANNTVEWVELNKDQLAAARADFEETINKIIEGLLEFDHHLLGLKAKDCIFPQERNLELSRFTDSYKTHLGAYIAMGGMKSDFAGYYIQIQPGNSFLGGGMYAPASPVLRKIRQEIDFNPDELKVILDQPGFKDEFGGLVDNKREGAPKGYPKDHRDIELLQYQGFFGIKEIDDDMPLDPDFEQKVTHTFESIFPLNKFLNEIFIN